MITKRLVFRLGLNRPAGHLDKPGVWSDMSEPVVGEGYIASMTRQCSKSVEMSIKDS